MARRKKRRRVHLGRMRKSVSVLNRLYGYFVQALDAHRHQMTHLDTRIAAAEKRLGLKWSYRLEDYES